MWFFPESEIRARLQSASPSAGRCKTLIPLLCYAIPHKWNKDIGLFSQRASCIMEESLFWKGIFRFILLLHIIGLVTPPPSPFHAFKFGLVTCADGYTSSSFTSAKREEGEVWLMRVFVCTQSLWRKMSKDIFGVVGRQRCHMTCLSFWKIVKVVCSSLLLLFKLTNCSPLTDVQSLTSTFGLQIRI